MAQNSEKQAPEIVEVPFDTDQVVCDGGVGPLGHPQVWYTFDGKTEISCHYCGRKFVKT
ncbi:MAG: zinc-finger domain-containing protein [Alphaproteobacteria bacterium]|nr:zinc-finger domain-containing protein [Alphaproteobacteria bacterium]